MEAGLLKNHSVSGSWNDEKIIVILARGEGLMVLWQFVTGEFIADSSSQKIILILLEIFNGAQFLPVPVR